MVSRLAARFSGVALAMALALGGAAGAQTPRAFAPSIEELMRLRELGTYFGGLSLSPDGAHIAVFERQADLGANDIRYRLLVFDAAARPQSPRQIGDGGGILPHTIHNRPSGGLVDRLPQWSPDGASVAYIAERAGHAELWLSRPGAANGEAIARPDGDVAAFAWLSSNQLVFQTLTPRAELARQTQRDANLGYRLDDTLDPGFSLRPLADLEAGRATYTLDLRGGAVSPAPESEAAALNPAAASPPIPRAWVAPRDPHLNVDTPPRGLFFAGGDGAALMCATSACAGALGDAGLTGDGGVWFVKNQGFALGDVGVYVWSPASGAVRRLRAGDEKLFGCLAAHGFLFCLHESATHPRRLVAIDLSSGALHVVHDPNPVWNAQAFPPIERIEFRDDHGLESYAHLVYPPGYRRGRRYPMVIVQYRSRGFLRGGTGGEFPVFPIAARGYFVLSVERPNPNARAAEISTRDLDREGELGGQERRMKLVALNALIDQVVRRGLIDLDRIAITGMSDGAETLFWAISERRYAAAVSSSPPTDPSAWWMHDQGFRDSLTQEQGVTPPWPDATEEPWTSWWRANGAIYYANRIRAPLLMNLSESEAAYAIPLHVRLRELGAPVESYFYPGAYHTKWRPRQILAAQGRAIAWIDFWLRGVDAADPADPERRQRWTHMREALQRLDALAPQ